MMLRTFLVMLLALSIGAQAAKKPVKSAKSSQIGKSSKIGKSTKARKSKKPRKAVNREKIREESLAAWPKWAELDSRPTRVGVPELDRLLVERPPLGSPVTEDPSSGSEEAQRRPMPSENRDRGLASVAMSSSENAPLEQLRKVAEPFLGSPYRTGGESTSGFDCSGFVLTMLRAFGQKMTGRSSPEFYKQGEPVEKDRLQTGDILYFADHSRSIGHVAIYLAEGKFVHASVQRGVIVSDLEEKYYKAKYKAARRLDGFANALRSGIQPTTDFAGTVD